MVSAFSKRSKESSSIRKNYIYGHQGFMTMTQDYRELNRNSWNSRVAAHMESDFYNMTDFMDGKTSLNEIELARLGDLSGKKVLHLQCHFGQDTISLARMGASVTGVDLSDKAIEAARGLAEQTGADAKFICCDIYDLPQLLDTQFDLVFTSYGTIGWLPDLDKWAAVVSRYLKPGGKFLFVEFHPFVWIFDNAFENIIYSYFNKEQIEETESGTYADRDAAIAPKTITWNHPISEVVGTLLRNGISIQSLDEFDYSPYDCFEQTEEIAPGRFVISHLQGKLPMVYAIEGLK